MQTHTASVDAYTKRHAIPQCPTDAARERREKTSHNIDLADLALMPPFAAQPASRISYETFFRPNFLVEDAQSLGAIYTTVW
jgi:hypothetical protein